MKRVLVTGASGFVGRGSIPELVARGYDVHVVSQTLRSDWPKGVVSHQADLLDAIARQDLVRAVRPTHLLHFAWYAENGKFWTALENVAWTEASLGLLRDFAAVGGHRATFAGTCAEYAWTTDADLTESAPREPTTLYGICKNSLRAVIEAAAPQMGVSLAWGRIFFIYGPAEARARLVASAIVKLLTGEPASFTHGRQVRDFLHVADLARGFVELLDSAITGPMNIASGQPIALRDVIQRIGELTERPDLINLGAIPASANEPPRIVADISRLKNELGFAPRYDLLAGLRATIDWWRQELQ